MSRIHEEAVATALKLIPADLLGKPFTTPISPRIGVHAHHIPTGTTFRVLCNCATATPPEHTQRYVGGRYHDYRYPTEAEIRAALAPRMTFSPTTTEAP